METGISRGVARTQTKRILVPRPSQRRFYGYGIPGVDVNKLAGKLIVVEGADGSGRSTQIAKLVDWLEECGHGTVQVGLKRSTLVSAELEEAQQGNILSHTTLSLFYATDFADQLENIIMPALRAGFMVLADRYIYTLMARDIVRGIHRTRYIEYWWQQPEPRARLPARARLRVSRMRHRTRSGGVNAIHWFNETSE